MKKINQVLFVFFLFQTSLHGFDFSKYIKLSFPMFSFSNALPKISFPEENKQPKIQLENIVVNKKDASDVALKSSGKNWFLIALSYLIPATKGDIEQALDENKKYADELKFKIKKDRKTSEEKIVGLTSSISELDGKIKDLESQNHSSFPIVINALENLKNDTDEKIENIIEKNKDRLNNEVNSLKKYFEDKDNELIDQKNKIEQNIHKEDEKLNQAFFEKNEKTNSDLEQMLLKAKMINFRLKTLTKSNENKGFSWTTMSPNQKIVNSNVRNY